MKENGKISVYLYKYNENKNRKECQQMAEIRHILTQINESPLLPPSPSTKKKVYRRIFRSCTKEFTQAKHGDALKYIQNQITILESYSAYSE